LPPAPTTPTNSAYDIVTANINYSSISYYYEAQTSTLQDSSSLYPSLSPLHDMMSALQQKFAVSVKKDALPTKSAEDPNQVNKDYYYYYFYYYYYYYY
jgi:hypothetical protein